jgi:ABC-type glycerol-3-phosphate transport system substrate-binding protein
MNKFQSWMFRALVIMILLLVCACTDIPEPSSNEVLTTITFLPTVSDYQHYLELAKTFNAQNPNVKVEVLNAGEVLLVDPALSTMENFSKHASVADVFMFSDLAPTTLGESGLVQDLSRLLENDVDFDVDDLVIPLFAEYQDSTGVYGFPITIVAPVIYYDKAAWSANGISTPSPDWTWEEFVTIAQELTTSDDYTWGFYDDQYMAAVGSVYLNGGQWTVDSGPTLADPLAIDAIDRYVTLAQSLHVMPSDNQECNGKFDCAGRAGMWVATSTARQRMDVGILSLPSLSNDGTVPVHPQVVYVSSATQSTTAAWQWIRFLTRQVPPFGQLPVRQSVFDSQGYHDQLEEQTYSTYKHILSHLSLNPMRYPWFRTILIWLQTEGIPAIVQELSTSEAVLENAQLLALNVQSTKEYEGGQVAAPLPAPSPISTTDNPAIVTMPIHSRSAALDAIITDFQKTHADIHIRLKLYPQDAFAMTLAEQASSTDVIDVGSAVPFDGSLLLNLQPMVELDSKFSVDDFYPAAINPYQNQGQLWAVPKQVDAYMLFYNKRLFDEAGLDYPTADWTWDDFLIAAKQLTRAEKTPQQWGTAFRHFNWSILPRIKAAQMRDQYSDDDYIDILGTPRLDNRALIDAVQWTVDLVHEYGVAPEPTLDLVSAGELPCGFSEGCVAMLMTTQRATGVTASSGQVDLGVVPLPVTGTPATDYSLYGYAVSVETEHPEAVWEWLTYLTYQTSVMEAWPARRSVGDDAVFPLTVQSVHGELSQAYRTSLIEYQDAAKILWNDSLHQDVIERLITMAVRNVWERKGTPQGLLTEAQTVFEAYVKCVGDDYSKTRLDTCAIQAGVPDWLSVYIP